MDGAQLPRWQCHKRVNAAKIECIQLRSATGDPADGADLIFSDPPGSVFVDAAFLAKHTPQEGGYFVAYDDGYGSFSPYQAFEEGYTRL